MFRQAKNIDTAFRQVKVFTLLVITGCFMITGYAIYLVNKVEHESGKRIYILANGKILDANVSNRQDNIQVEAKDHIKVFHQYFFTLDPDDKVIQANISKALYLADGSAKEIYENLKGNNYYSNIISGNISQSSETDSIQLNLSSYPYYFRFYGKQKITRPVSIVTRNLVTEGYLRNVARSDNNPHGFLIEKWKILANEDLNTKVR